MLIAGVAALMMAATAAPPRRSADCVMVPIAMAWHGGAGPRRGDRLRDLRIGQDWRPATRCFRLAAR